MESPLTSLSNEIAAAVEGAAGAVVAIAGRRRFASSGVIWREGVVVTAEHALRGDDPVAVHGPDGSVHRALIAGRDPGTDLAVLKVEDLRGAPLTSHAREPLRTGQIALAVSRVPETGPCASMGIISGTGPAWQSWRGGRLDSFIRLDIALYPWSSGGAVVDAAGALIGLATTGLSRVSSIAIPLSTVGRIAGELLERGRIVRGYFGLGLQTIPLPEPLKSSLGLNQDAGQIVLSVAPGGPAARGGIVLGDILLSADGKTLEHTRDVQSALGSDSVGKAVSVTLLRGGERVELSVTVGERPHRGG